MQYVNNLRPSEDGMLSCYTDGDQYSRSPFFMEHPHAFQLCFYYDDVDPTNAQGPKSGLHELGHFCVTILNIPQWINSSLDGIFPVVLANSSHCKGNFEEVLTRFMKEVNELEGGVRKFINGEFVELRATLVGVKADSKAAHEILGFIAAGARHFCRLCMISRQELHAGDVAIGQLRTPELCEQHLMMVANNPAYDTNCGMRYNSWLNRSVHFHVANNRCFDLMHDGAEGVIIMLIRLCMKRFICVENRFTVQELNQRIFAFNYGKQNAKDIPAPNFSVESLREANRVHKQKQNAAQTLVLFRALPFLLDDLGANPVPEDNEYLEYMLLLLHIYQLLSAPKIHRDVLPHLERQQEVFRRTWYELFPDVNPVNRFHHFAHSAHNTREMGPQRQFWCFREEGKNCPLKRHVAVTNNYKNPLHTTLEQSQIYQAKIWGTDSPSPLRSVNFAKKSQVAVHTLPVAAPLIALGFHENQLMNIAEVAYVQGYEYRVGEFVLYSKGLSAC